MRNGLTTTLGRWINRIRGKYKMRPNQMRKVVTSNFRRVWASKGSNIGSDWNGNDLIKSGQLFATLTDGSNISFQGSQINIVANTPYASFVNARYPFMELDARAMNELFLSYTGELEND